LRGCSSAGQGTQAIARKRLAGDQVTIIAITILVCVTGNLIHEAVGHGGACLAVGGRWVLLTTVNMDCSVDNRLVTAGGTLMNLIAAVVFWALLRRTRAGASAWRYFFWLAMTVNLYAAAGYFLFSGIGGFGDWAEFIRGLEPQGAWRVGLSLFGMTGYMLAVRFSLLELRPLIGSDPYMRYRRGVELSRWPYVVIGTLACIAGALNPGGMWLVALSAAASTFGGGSGLLWMMEWLKAGWIPPRGDAEPAPIGKSWAWIAVAALAACVWIAVIGPGLRFAR